MLIRLSCANHSIIFNLLVHLILGDFNTHVNDKSDPLAVKFLELLDRYNLIQHVKVPTHRAGNTLDLVITNDDLSVTDIRTDNLVPSDHYCVLFQVSAPSHAVPKQTHTGSGPLSTLCHSKLQLVNV